MRTATARILTTLLVLAASPDSSGASDEVADGRAAEQVVAEESATPPGVLAREAELGAAQALRDAEPAWVDEVELRLEQEVGDGGYGAELKARVPLRLPGETDLQRSVREAELGEARARLDEARQGESLRACRQGIDAGAAEAHQRLSLEHEQQLAPILAWSRRAERAGAVTTEAAQRLELRSLSRALEVAPLGVVTPGSAVGTLPDLPQGALGLIQDPDTIAREIRAHASEVRIALSRQSEQEARGELELAKQGAFVRFVELGVEPVARNGSSGTVRTEVGVRVPFGDRAAYRKAHASRASAARLEVREAVASRVPVAQALLAQLDAAAAAGPRWRELLALAERAEGHAAQLVAGRIGPPDRAGRLLEEAVEARREAIDQRRSFGLLSCELQGLTGVLLADWPRQP